MNGALSRTIINLSILVVLIGWVIFWSITPLSILLNNYFTPCENSFTYDYNTKTCRCEFPFHGDLCEKHFCENGSPERTLLGWKCKCIDRWFGKYCTLCGTHDSGKTTCKGDLPWPNSELCTNIEHSMFGVSLPDNNPDYHYLFNEYTFQGEVDFIGGNCQIICLKLENARSLRDDALQLYNDIKNNLIDNPDNIIACPDALCYGCTDTGALCVDGAVKSRGSVECNLICEPCDDNICQPCNHRGTCVLRGDNPTCQCQPLARGSTCEKICPGVTEVYNGITTLLIGPGCYGHGQCNDEAICECEEDTNNNPTFIQNCKFECPVENGLVCSGHGTCQMDSSGLNAECVCDESWFNSKCSCSDGSLNDEKTCVQGECDVNGLGCECYDDEIRGHWKGEFCTLCKENWFTEKTFCLQYCNAETTCEGNANRCVVKDFVVSENTGDIFEPCSVSGTSFQGTCAVCECLGTFNDTITYSPLTVNQTENKSLAYQCGSCKNDFYPKTDVLSADPDVEKCSIKCNYEICNERGACMIDSGDCTCYGSCNTDSDKYNGKCLMKTESVTEYKTIQPRFNAEDRCGTCTESFQPNINGGVYWNSSCVYFCNHLFNEESTFPDICKLDDGTIREECVFCSGKADSCTSSGLPTCNCLEGFAGTYCQSTCNAAGSSTCTNGECKINKLANWFDLKTLPYNRKSSNSQGIAPSFECQCDPQDEYTTEERNEYEQLLYLTTIYDVIANFDDIENLKIRQPTDFFGTQCNSLCKADLEGQVCSNRGDCKSYPIVGLANNAYCNSDSECNVLPETAFEDQERFCHFEKIPKYWQYVNTLQTSYLNSCTQLEVDWIKTFIERYDWDRFCYNYVSTTIPEDLNNMKCTSCAQLTDDKVLWANIADKCNELIQFSNYESLGTLSKSCSLTCTLAVRNFDWKSWCSQPKEVFEEVCPDDCLSQFKKVDWVTSSGFCGIQNQFTTNNLLKTNACSVFIETDRQSCEFVSVSESTTEYEETSSCFIGKEFAISPRNGVTINQPYSGSDNQVICHSVDDLTPQICGVIEHTITFTERSCDSSITNSQNTGMNDCRLKDAEHLYCSTLFPSGWSTFGTEYVVLVNDHPDGIIYATDTQLSVNVSHVESVTNNTLTEGAIVNYELFGTQYVGTLIGECNLEAPRCFSCGAGNTLKDGTGAVINTEDKLASNYNPTPERCCNAEAYFQKSTDQSTFWCHENGAYGVDFCAYDKCTTSIESYSWQEKIQIIRAVKTLNVSDQILGLQEPQVRDSFSLSSYCRSRESLDLKVAEATTFSNYAFYCNHIDATEPKDLSYFTGNTELSTIISNEALVVDKLLWWGSLYEDELQELGIGVQDLVIPSSTDVYTLTSSKLIKTFSIDDTIDEEISLWMFVPYDKYRYLLDIELKNKDNILLAKLELRREQFYFNYENTAFIITSSNLVKGYWFHLKFSFNTDLINLRISGAGRVQNIDENYLCGSSCLDKNFKTLTLRQPEFKDQSVVLHDLRISNNIEKSYLYNVWDNVDVNYGHCSDYLEIPTDIESKVCKDEYDNVTECKRILVEVVQWPLICSVTNDLHNIDDSVKYSFCNNNEICLDAVNNFLTSEIDSWVDAFISSSTVPLEIRDSTECAASSLVCRQSLETFDYENFCETGLNAVYNECDDCSAEFTTWRAEFKKEEFCNALDTAEEEVATFFNNEISNCSGSCKETLNEVNYIDFCSNRLSAHDVFSPHALSFNLSSYCREQIFVSLPTILESSNHDMKKDYDIDCTSLGTYGSVNLYTENNVQKSGQCRKLTCECTEIGVGGDRCNIDCPISSVDNSACNSGSGLGQCCLDPIDGSQLTASNCETDILTSSLGIGTTIGACVCYNAGTDSYITGYNCEEKCKKCNLENGQCSLLTGTCLCVNNAFRTTIKSEIINFQKEFSDFQLTSTLHEIDTKTFDNVVYAKKYCQSLNDCVGIINTGGIFSILIKSTDSSTTTTAYISDYDTPQIKDINDETGVKEPIIFDWGNKETPEGSLTGDQTLQVHAVLLYSPDDPCIMEMNSISIDKCCTWSTFTDSEKNPFNYGFDPTLVTADLKVNWPTDTNAIRLSDYAKNAEPTNRESVTSRLYEHISESRCPSYRLVNGRYRVEINTNGWEPLPVVTSKYVMYKNKWCEIKAYSYNGIDYVFDESKYNFGLITDIECPNANDNEMTDHAVCQFPFFVSRYNEIKQDFVIEEIRDCTDINIFNGYPGKQIEFSSDGSSVVDLLFDFQSIESEISSITGIQNPKYCITKKWLQNVTEYIVRQENRFNETAGFVNTCRKNEISRNKCTSAVSDLQEGNCLCGTEVCLINQYCYTRNVDETVIHECYECNDLLSPAPETCCNVGEYLHYQTFGPASAGQCVTHGDQNFKSYCVNEWACPINAVIGKSVTHGEEEIVLSEEDLNDIQTRLVNKLGITITNTEIENYTPIINNIEMQCVSGRPNSATCCHSVTENVNSVEDCDAIVTPEGIDAFQFNIVTGKCSYYSVSHASISGNTNDGNTEYLFCKKSYEESVPLCGQPTAGSFCSECPCNTIFKITSSSHYYDQHGWYEKGSGAHPELFCELNSCWDYASQSCVTDCNCDVNNDLTNVLGILKSTEGGALVGGYHLIDAINNFDTNIISTTSNEYSVGKIPIDFIRICKDTSASIADNSDMTPTVEEENIFEENEFVRTDKASASNPSLKCGDDCNSVCPGSNLTTGVPCNGRGICNVDCSCSCFSFSSFASRSFFLKESKEGGTVEVPSYAVGSASAFQSPFRGKACEATCPGWEEGMIGYKLPSNEDKDFIMDQLICSGKGTCLLNNKGTSQCACEDGYVSGKDGNCEFVCPGSLSEQGTCAGHGTCSVKYVGATGNKIEGLIRLYVDLNEFEELETITVVNGMATMLLKEDKLMGLNEKFEIGDSTEFQGFQWVVSNINSAKEYLFEIPLTIANGVYTGGKLYHNEFENYNHADFTLSASYKMLTFVERTTPFAKQESGVYYTTNAGKQTTEDLLQEVKFISACPSTHPYTYHYGMYCCNFEKVANGTTLNKRSVISECPVLKRMRCPTISWYKQNTLMKQKLKQQNANFQDGDEILINMQKSSTDPDNQFTDNPNHYTCDPDIEFVKINREIRPFYDTWAIFELSTGVTENLMFSYQDTHCNHISVAQYNLNGLNIQNQPQTIQLLQCSSCNCEKSSKQGFWDGLTCENCEFGFYGNSCKNQCNGVCGTIDLGANQIWYEEYQKTIDSSDPCSMPVRRSGLFYACPSIEAIETITEAKSQTFLSEYKRSVYCLDGKDAPGSCISCPEPLVGNIDLRFPSNPDQVCQILECPDIQSKLFSVAALDGGAYSNDLFLSTFYEHEQWTIIGPSYDTFNDIENFDKNTAINMFSINCPTSHPFDVREGFCCTTTGKNLNHHSIGVNGLYNNFIIPSTEAGTKGPMSIEACAEKALEQYAVSKGFFARAVSSQDCYIYNGRASFNVEYVTFPLTSISDWNSFMASNTIGLTLLLTDLEYHNYWAYYTCIGDETISKNFNTFADVGDATKTVSLTKTYERVCEFDLNGDILQDIDLYEDADTRDLSYNNVEKIEILRTNQCIKQFYIECKNGHDIGIQNPFLTWYAYKKINDHMNAIWPANAVEEKRCRWEKIINKVWCPQCPLCEYSGTTPNEDLELNPHSCVIGYFPYCGQNNYIPEIKPDPFEDWIDEYITDSIFTDTAVKDFLIKEAKEAIPDKFTSYEVTVTNKRFLKKYGEYIQCKDSTNSADCVDYDFHRKEWRLQWFDQNGVDEFDNTVAHDHLGSGAEKITWAHMKTERDTNVHYPFFKEETAIDTIPDTLGIIFGNWTRIRDLTLNPSDSSVFESYKEDIVTLCYENDGVLPDNLLNKISNRDRIHGEYSNYKQLFYDIECPTYSNAVDYNFAILNHGEYINSLSGAGLTKVSKMGPENSLGHNNYRSYFYHGVIILDSRILTSGTWDSTEIDYETAIKPYCFSGAQENKFAGKCLDLKNSNIDGNIFYKIPYDNQKAYQLKRTAQSDLPVALTYDLIIEHDVAIIVHKDGKYYNFIKVDYDSSSEFGFGSLPYEVPFYNYRENQCRGRSQDLHNLEFSESIGTGLPTHQRPPVTFKDMGTVYGIEKGFAPMCECSLGHSNTRYSDYNQPFELQHSCLTIASDPEGKLKESSTTCNTPFPGCAFGKRNGETAGDADIECLSSTSSSTNNGNVADQWVKLNDPNAYSQVGVVYDDNDRPLDSRATSFSWQTTGCYGCDNGRYQNELGKEECKICPAGKYYNSANNPWKDAPTKSGTNSVESDRVKAPYGSAYAHEWWKIRGYPPAVNTWHEVDEWVVNVKAPTPMYKQDSTTKKWVYDSTTTTEPTVTTLSENSGIQTSSCYDCPDNWASVPFDTTHSNGDVYDRYPSFKSGTNMLRGVTGNRNCLICPPGYDTGVADHLSGATSSNSIDDLGNLGMCPSGRPYARKSSVASGSTDTGASYCCTTIYDHNDEPYAYGNDYTQAEMDNWLATGQCTSCSSTTNSMQACRDYVDTTTVSNYRTSCNGVWDPKIYRLLYANSVYQDAESWGRELTDAGDTLIKCANKASEYYNRHIPDTNIEVSDERRVFEYDSLNRVCMVFLEDSNTWEPSVYARTTDDNVDIYVMNPEVSGLTGATCLIMSFLDSGATGKEYCRRCPKGKFNPRAGSNCIPCPPGQYADDQGLESCKVCAKGKYAYGAGSSHCDLCPPGQYVNFNEEGNSMCNLCQAGKYQDESEQETCKDCAAGKIIEKNYYDSSLDASVLRIGSSWTNYVGPLKEYDQMFDYSGVHGMADRDASDGYFVAGYSPVFEYLRNQQQEAHDSASDCIDCPVGSYGVNGVSCAGCSYGKYSTEIGVSDSDCDDCVGKELSYDSSISKNGYYYQEAPFIRTDLTTLHNDCDPDVSLILQKSGADTSSIDFIQQAFEFCTSETSCRFLKRDGTSYTFYKVCVIQVTSSTSTKLYKRETRYINLNHVFPASTTTIKVFRASISASGNGQGVSYTVTDINDCITKTGELNSMLFMYGGDYCKVLTSYKPDAVYELSKNPPIDYKFMYDGDGALHAVSTSVGSGTHLYMHGSFTESNVRDTPGYNKCEDCPTGFYANDQGTCRKCLLGEYLDTSATPNTCVNCPTGKYQNEFGIVTDCKTCGAGKYQDEEAKACPAGVCCKSCAAGRTTTSYNSVNAFTANAFTCKADNVCCPCVAGRYQPNSEQTSCARCAAGQYQNVEGQLTCKNCPQGRVGQSGVTGANTLASGCGQCANGQYQDEEAKLTCKGCPIGKSGSTGMLEATAESDCTACAVGKYQDETGRTTCKNKQSCNAGKYYSGISIYEDATCTNCQNGKFQNQNGIKNTNTHDGIVACTTWSTCSAGQKVTTTPTAVVNTVCGACPASKYRSNNGHLETSCLDWKTCPAGTYFSGGSATYVGNCIGCAAGKYQPQNGGRPSSCTDCPNGQYQDETEKSGCKVCPIGRVAAGSFTGHQTLNSGCLQCAAGSYNDETGVTGATFIDLCITLTTPAFLSYKNPVSERGLGDTPGYDGWGEVSTIRGTGAATVTTNTANCQAQTPATCKPCPNGQYQDSTGQSSCKDCPAGTMTDDFTPNNNNIYPYIGEFSMTSSDKCVTCSSGRYQDQAGQTTCKICETGKYSTTSSSSSCEGKCPAGKYMHHNYFVWKHSGQVSNDEKLTEDECRAVFNHLLQEHLINPKADDIHMLRVYTTEAYHTDSTNFYNYPHYKDGVRVVDSGSMPCGCVINAWNWDADHMGWSGGVVYNHRNCDDLDHDVLCQQPDDLTDTISMGKQCIIKSTNPNLDLITGAPNDESCHTCPEWRNDERPYRINDDVTLTPIPYATSSTTEIDMTVCGDYFNCDDDGFLLVDDAFYQDEEGQSQCKHSVNRCFCNYRGGSCILPSQNPNAQPDYRGHYFTENWPTANNVCTECPDGQYLPTNENREPDCRVHASCPAGKYVNRVVPKWDNINVNGVGGAPSDCTNCPAGRYQSQETRALTCVSCVPGKYMDTTGATQCKACPAGKYAGTTQLQACVLMNCVSGKYNDETGKTAVDCKDCPLGSVTDTRSAVGGTTCTGCPAGKYGSSTWGCGNCGKGKYQNEAGKTGCIRCAATTWTDYYGATVCKSCPSGRTWGGSMSLGRRRDECVARL